MEGPEIKAVEAVIDNGSFGKRTLRFETGRLAQQADGAVAAYLDDDSMIPRLPYHRPPAAPAVPAHPAQRSAGRRDRARREP